jgi:hypothetical protein
VSHGLNAILKREGSGNNPHPYNNGRETVTHKSNSWWIETSPLDLIGFQILDYGGTNCGLPNLSERVQADRTGLLGKKVHFGTCQLDPKVGAGASNQTWLRGDAIIVMLCLDR